MNDSVYSLSYDPEDQMVFLEDLVNAEVHSTMPWMTFWNLTVNHFGHQKAERIALTLTAGRGLRISWVDQKVGMTPSSPYRAPDVMARLMSISTIEETRAAAESHDPRDLTRLRQELVSSLSADF